MPRPTGRAGCPSCRCSRTNRAKQPINGVILAISVEDLLTLPTEELDRACQRDPQAPVRAAPGAEDRFPGLCAVHQGRPDRRVSASISATSPRAAAARSGARPSRPRTARRTWSAQVPAEFDALVRRLTEELPDRLHEEPDAIARIAIFGFPGAVRRAARPRRRIPQPHLRADALPGQRQSARLLFLVRHAGRHADRPGAGRDGPQPRRSTTAPASFPGAARASSCTTC